MSNTRCTFTTSDHRRCTSPVYSGHDSLCHQHLLQQLKRTTPPDDIAADLLAGVQNFQSGAAVNAALGKLLTMLAAGRVKRKNAIAMAYICQLLLQSIKEFKHETRLTTYEPLFERDLLKILNTRTPLTEFILPLNPPEPEPEPEPAQEADLKADLDLESGQQLREQRPAENPPEDVNSEANSAETLTPKNGIPHETLQPDTGESSTSEVTEPLQV